MQPMRLSRRNYIIIFSTCILMLAGCHHWLNSSPGHLPVTILGIDGATWEIIDPLIEKGSLPGFKRLKEEGAWSSLETFQPTESVAIWTSIATGVAPTKHGIQSFTRRLPGTDETVPSPSTDRKVPAIWNIASDAQKKVVCVKWFATWPAEKVNGVMISPRLEKDSGGFETYPQELFSEISRFRYKSTMDKLPGASNIKNKNQTIDFTKPGVLIGKNQIKEKMFDDTSVWEAGKYVYHKFPSDLFMIYFKSIDRAEHFLWGSHDVLVQPLSSPKTYEKAEGIFAWYRYFDDIILELMKDPDRLLLVVSDHGMHGKEDYPEPFDFRYVNFDLILQDLGFQKSIRTKVTDWSQTQAYQNYKLPYDYEYALNINLQGREPNGSVPVTEKDLVLKNLKDSLSLLKTSTGIPLITQFKINFCDSDLVCKINSNVNLTDILRLNNKTIQLSRWIEHRQLPDGIHTKAPPGIFAAWGPCIKTNYHLSRANVFDITPTALYVMGLPVAKDFDGKCLQEIFTPDFTRSNRLKTINSYGNRALESPLKRTKADDRLKDELKALGYI